MSASPLTRLAPPVHLFLAEIASGSVPEPTRNTISVTLERSGRCCSAYPAAAAVWTASAFYLHVAPVLEPLVKARVPKHKHVEIVAVRGQQREPVGGMVERPVLPNDLTRHAKNGLELARATLATHDKRVQVNP